jgi:hypothetical protein
MGCDGYGLHAGVVIGARDRKKGLERLCRYIARPPLTKSRLELMERLAALVPPPGKNQVLCHGVLASRAAWRQQIVPQPKRSRRSDHAHTRAIIRPERVRVSAV